MIEYGPLCFGRPDCDKPLVEWQEHYRLDDARISRSLGAALAPEVADLIDIAVAVYVTDRLRRRRPAHKRDDGCHWQRRLPVEVAVRSPQWREPEVSRRLHELLAWLTDDAWAVTIIDDGPRRSRPAVAQATLFEEPLAKPAQVGLLSGGLDSLLGAAADCVSGGELLLVSTATLPKLAHLQRQMASKLSLSSSRRLRHLAVPMNLTAAGKSLVEGAEEPSQRTRAFVFLALGVAAAITGHANELRVYENGPGALNLALSPSQRGSMNTRAMRPETLRMMSTLVSQLIGQPFAITNPNMWRTKAEMVAAAPHALDAAIASSKSCDTALTGRRHGDAPCGACTSCILRRQALIAGGRADLDALDVDDMRGDSLRAPIPGHVTTAVRLMLGQVHALRKCLRADDPWAAFVTRWPDLSSARVALDAPPSRLVDLLARYCREWERVPSPVVQRLLHT